MPIKSFRDLLVWQRSMTLAEGVYALANAMPVSERYGLARQLKRAVVSIPSNIAEGRARAQTRAYISHLVIALGSEAELHTQLELAVRLRLAPPEQVKPLHDAAAEVGRMLRGLIFALEAKDQGRRRP
jgi:four helix bundle protein